MATLLNTLRVLSSAVRAQSTSDGVGGLRTPVFKPSINPPTAIPGDGSRTSDAAPILPSIPFVSTVPQGMQPELKNSALRALQVALQQKSPGVPLPNFVTLGGAISAAANEAASEEFSPTGAGQLINVAEAAFKSSVSISVFNQLVPTVRALATKSGVSPTKVNLLINATASVVNTGLGKTILNAPTLFGTSFLVPTAYTRFAQEAINTVTSEFALSGLDTSAHRVVATQSRLTTALEVPVEYSLGPGETIVGNSPSTISQDATQVPVTNKKVFLRSSSDQSEVFFEHQPVISITDTATYTQLSPIHMPTAFNTFSGNPPVKYTLSDVKLFSRTPEEASKNMVILARLRGWLKPTFGVSSVLEGADLDTATTVLPSTEKVAYSMKQGTPLRALEYRNGIAGAQNEATSQIPKVLVNPAATNAPRYTTTTELDPVNQALGNTGKVRYPQSKVGTGYQTNANDELVNRILRSNQRQVITNQGNPLRALEYRNGIPGAQNEDTTGGSGVDSAAAARAKALLPTSAETEVRQLGSPPEVLYLYAYTNDSAAPTDPSDSPHNIYRVPVGVESIGYSYPNDVDYVPSTTGIPWPAVMTLTITLVSLYSPREVEQFSLDDFKTGRLVGW